MANHVTCDVQDAASPSFYRGASPSYRDSHPLQHSPPASVLLTSSQSESPSRASGEEDSSQKSPNSQNGFSAAVRKERLRAFAQGMQGMQGSVDSSASPLRHKLSKVSALVYAV
jgi:hypothetical protein